MKYQIKHRYTNAVLFECELTDQERGMAARHAIEKAVAANADLQGADLQGADLRDADLRDADLRDADLQCAYLRGAYLRGANLRDAYLRDAYLRDADLRDADLRGAYLRGAYLQGADLRGADLQGAYLRGANLQGVNLQGVNLQGAMGADYAISQTRILAEGQLIGWKKCLNSVIVKLSIPATAKRSHAFGRKCRAEFVEVLEVIGAEVAISSHDRKTEYRVGAVVKPDSFSENWMDECAPGIHFFITRIEAENY